MKYLSYFYTGLGLLFFAAQWFWPDYAFYLAALICVTTSGILTQMRGKPPLLSARLLVDRLVRTVPVEDYLLSAAKGSAPLPDKEKCRQMAFQLGVPADLAVQLMEGAE